MENKLEPGYYLEVVEVEYQPGDWVGPFDDTGTPLRVEQRNLKYFVTIGVWRYVSTLDVAS